MKRLVNPGKWWFVVLVLVLGVAGVRWWNTRIVVEPPEFPVLIARFEKAVGLGWGWLHAENTQVRSWSHSGNDVLAELVYTIVLDKNAEDLPPDEIERFTQFLPMCAGVPLVQGSRCQVIEAMAFVETPEFGFMPAPFVLHRPDMLAAIAGAAPAKAEKVETEKTGRP